jgi:predicted nucleic acid-binding protein
MAVKIIDASAAAAFLFNEPEAELVAECIDGHRLIAPDIISYELTSVCLKKIRSAPSHEVWFRAACSSWRS